MIKIKNVQKTYGKDVISYNDLTFEKGKSYVILGPSGCGKTTLLNLLGAQIQPNKGEVIYTLKDKPLYQSQMKKNELKEFRRNNISYISQDFKLFEDLNAINNLKLLSQVRSTSSNIDEVLKYVGLSEKSTIPIKKLSGGEKQRVAIARAILLNANIMLCDEPTASLNYTLAENTINLLTDLHKKTNNLLIVVTHDDRFSKFFDVVINCENLIKETNDV